MCEVWPGPRCNDKCQTRDVKRELFYQISKTHGKYTYEYNNALAELIESQKIYDTTPRGIKELYNTVYSQEESTESIQKMNLARLVTGKSTRMMQTEALKEIQNGRVGALSRIVSSLTGFYSPEEVESIIASARENKEASALNNAYLEIMITKTDTKNINPDEYINSITAKEDGTYYEFIDKIGNALNEKYGNNIPQQLIDDSHILDGLEPPSSINFHAYRSIGNALNKAQEQTSQEIMRISAIQDAPANVTAEYFDAYRKFYQESYSNLPSTERPDPPREWVEGSLPNSGITKNSNTTFIPRDPATLYAIYKLRTDLNAIPDYLKQSTKISAIDKTIDGFTVTHLSRTGKELNKENYNESQNLNDIIKRYIKDSVVIIDKPSENMDNEIKTSSRIIYIDDIVSKHFNTASDKLEYLAPEFNAKENVMSLYSAMRKKILKTWSTKPLRNSALSLDFAPSGKSRFNKLVR